MLRRPYGLVVALVLVAKSAIAEQVAERSLLMPRDASVAPGMTAARARAEQLHRQAETLLSAGDWSLACRLYGEAQALDPSATTQGRIAQCFEHEGKLASALQAYEQALELVPHLDEARRELAAERFPKYIADLAARVPELRVRAPRELLGVTLELDGVKIADASSVEGSSPLRLDPGPHTLTVAGAGSMAQRCELMAVEAARLEIELVRGGAATRGGCEPIGSTLRIVLEAAVKAAEAETSTGQPLPSTSLASGTVTQLGPTLPFVPPLPPPAAGAKPDADTDAAARQRTAGYVVGGAGALGLVVATYLGVRTLSLVGDAECNRAGECSARGVKTMREAERTQRGGFIAAGAGATLLGAGLALLALPPLFGSEPPTLEVAGESLCLSARW